METSEASLAPWARDRHHAERSILTHATDGIPPFRARGNTVAGTKWEKIRIQVSWFSSRLLLTIFLCVWFAHPTHTRIADCYCLFLSSRLVRRSGTRSTRYVPPVRLANAFLPSLLHTRLARIMRAYADASHRPAPSPLLRRITSRSRITRSTTAWDWSCTTTKRLLGLVGHALGLGRARVLESMFANARV